MCDFDSDVMGEEVIDAGDWVGDPFFEVKVEIQLEIKVELQLCLEDKVTEIQASIDQLIEKLILADYCEGKGALLALSLEDD